MEFCSRLFGYTMFSSLSAEEKFVCVHLPITCTYSVDSLKVFFAVFVDKGESTGLVGLLIFNWVENLLELVGVEGLFLVVWPPRVGVLVKTLFHDGKEIPLLLALLSIWSFGGISARFLGVSIFLVAVLTAIWKYKIKFPI